MHINDIYLQFLGDANFTDSTSGATVYYGELA